MRITVVNSKTDSLYKKQVDITIELDTNKYLVFLFYYHLVLVTKYCQPVIDNEIAARRKS
ncbi:hypothetical protein TEHAL1_07240 [Tetragenococcus halophilus]|nr:hypothetical protein YG2_15650 [Tetragenococcus halophilus]GMG63250.1 hypothetical protein TEHAL1_07240 [Tetragenococcus halophilus]GMG65874.1 hypothetical protein TEHIT2_10650 [Tetragenococcus halophilus]GMG67564.1 hypothetical protein TEHMS4_04990 [Tetragenococcus halophilus]